MDYSAIYETLSLLVERKFKGLGKEAPYTWYWYNTIERCWICYLCNSDLATYHTLPVEIEKHALNHLKELGLLTYL